MLRISGSLELRIKNNRTLSRPLRELKPDHTYHVTVRCNNRRFNLSRKLCREVFIHAIRRAKAEV